MTVLSTTTGTRTITETSQEVITPKVDITLERNSRGYNYSIKLKECDSATQDGIDAAVRLLEYAHRQVEARWGEDAVRKTVKAVKSVAMMDSKEG